MPSGRQQALPFGERAILWRSHSPILNLAAFRGGYHIHVRRKFIAQCDPLSFDVNPGSAQLCKRPDAPLIRRAH